MTKTTEKATATHPQVKPGDLFVCSWGYDQTNVDFYKVISRTAKTVRVQKWTAYNVADGLDSHDALVGGDRPVQWADWSGCDPEADEWTRREQVVMRDAPIRTRRLREDGSTPSFQVASYANAYLWDG